MAAVDTVLVTGANRGLGLEFTKQYAKENGYKMVLTFQTGNAQLLYADPSLDVTADYLKKLNDAYAKEKK